GHKPSVNQNSSHADCQSKNLLNRCSPLVLISKSGSCQSFVYKQFPISSSSIASIANFSSRTSAAINFIARTISYLLPYFNAKFNSNQLLSLLVAFSLLIVFTVCLRQV